MNRFDFTPYRRTTVGFDRLFDLLENQVRGNSGGDNYPPFNIERRGDDAYRITLAVAGFRAGDLDITAQQNLLVIQGRSAEETPQGEMLHVGIANRGFERRFELADFVRVDNADLDDGLLMIDLVREVPEAMKPKKIAVGGQPTLEVVRRRRAGRRGLSASSHGLKRVGGGALQARPRDVERRLCLESDRPGRRRRSDPRQARPLQRSSSATAIAVPRPKLSKRQSLQAPPLTAPCTIGKIYSESGRNSL